MALSFPSDPINGAVSGEYTYDATKGAWRKNAALPVSVAHSDFAPSNPRAGDQWWKSNEGTLFTYYNDGTSSQWVESVNVVANVEPNPIPAGAMMAWASNVIPANWLLCDGSAVSRSTYASLFAAVGTTYGSGDGTSTFNLPNLKGKTIVGKDASQTEFDTLGETGGAKTHTLTSAEMPSHTHSFSATTSTNGDHAHQAAYAGGSGGDKGYYGGTIFNNYGAWTTTNGAHTHTVSGTTGSAGSGSAHNNLQPYIVLNYIIKFSAGETPGDSELSYRVGVSELGIDAIESRATSLESRATSLETGVRGVSIGGTGTSTLTSGAYLKGAGTGAIAAQSGIPAGDITSGTFDYNRMPAGSVLQVQTVRYQGRPVWTYTTDSYITYLNVPITPRKANSLLICDFMVTGEIEYNSVFRSARDGALISQSGYEGYNTEDTNIWSGIAPVLYDTNLSSTPFNQFVRYFVPANNTNATTMQLAVRPTVSGATGKLCLNRTYDSSGASAYEIGVSYATVWEIAQ